MIAQNSSATPSFCISLQYSIFNVEDMQVGLYTEQFYAIMFSLLFFDLLFLHLHIRKMHEYASLFSVLFNSKRH